MNKLLLFIILFFLIYKNKEHFYGLNYVQQHNYLKCCNLLHCDHPMCVGYLASNASNLVDIGYMYKKDKTDKIFKIYSRLDKDTNRDEYFIKIINEQKDSILKKLDSRYLYDDDELTYDGDIYIVKIINASVGYVNPNKFALPSLYTRLGDSFPTSSSTDLSSKLYEPMYNKFGYVYETDPNKFRIIFVQYNGRYRRRYFVKYNEIYVHLEKYENKEIYDGDKIKINDKDHTFKKFSI